MEHDHNGEVRRNSKRPASVDWGQVPPPHISDKLMENPKDLAKRVGVSVAWIRELIHDKKLDHILSYPGERNFKIPIGAWERYLNNNMVRACPEQDLSQNLKSIERTRPVTITSTGQKVDEVEKSQLAHEIAVRLSSGKQSG